MLVQSTENEIHLLPALPDAWESGSAKGICARGGFDVSMEWNNKTLKKLSILAKVSGKTMLYFGSEKKEIALKKGEVFNLNL